MTETVEAPVRRGTWTNGRARAFDAALTAVLLLPVLFFPLASVDRTTTLLCFVQIVPLVMRRVQPTACFFVVAAAMALQFFLNDQPIWGQVALPVAVYAVAEYEEFATARVALGVGLLGAVAGTLDWLHARDGVSAGGVFLWFCTSTLLVVTPWALGMLARAKRLYDAEQVQRARRLEREEARSAALAAAEERARIAQEMHDAVTHGLSVILAQAEGARPTAPSRPDVAAGTLGSIAEEARSSLDEMRRMLALLRSAGTESAAGGQPGLDDLDTLVRKAREDGLRVTAELPDPAPEVSAGVGLTGYRLVEEALANVTRHAGEGAVAHVSVRVIGSDLVVEVLDDGGDADTPSRDPVAPPAHQPRGRGPRDQEPDSQEPGHEQDGGLAALRERLEVHGGHLEAGPRPGGGYQVRARIPLPFQEPAAD